jgi:hypothetical protein
MEVHEVRAIVREKNVAVARDMRAHSLGDQMPVICECGDPTCRGIALMPLAEFEEIMNSDDCFVIGQAHTLNAATIDVASGAPISLRWQ